MYLFLFLAFGLMLLLIMLNGRQSASIQRSKQSRKIIAPDVDLDSSLLSTDPFLMANTAPDPIPEAAQHNVPVDNYATGSAVDSVSFVYYSSVSAGGELGTALADSIDGGQSSFSTFDSGGNFDAGTPSDWN